MTRTLWLARLWDALARRSQRLADACDRRVAGYWRAWNGANARKAAAQEVDREIRRLIAETGPSTERLRRLHVGSPLHRDR